MLALLHRSYIIAADRVLCNVRLPVLSHSRWSRFFEVLFDRGRWLRLSRTCQFNEGGLSNLPLLNLLNFLPFVRSGCQTVPVKHLDFSLLAGLLVVLVFTSKGDYREYVFHVCHRSHHGFEWQRSPMRYYNLLRGAPSSYLPGVTV